MKIKIEIDKENYDYLWTIDGNKFGTAYDKTTCYGFHDDNLVNDGWEEVVAFNGSIFYPYNGATYAEGIEKSRGIVNQDWDTSFNDSMAIGCDYEGNIIFDSQANIKAKLNNYYGAITGAFGIYKDYSKWKLCIKENDAQFTVRSGRTVLGYDGKDYYVITQVGTTGKSGYTGVDLYDECKGLKDAICFDGGGSVWCRYFGKYITTTSRKVKNAVILYRKKKANTEKKDDDVKMKKVIDVSQWQGNIDFEKVKADAVDGVILRLGYTGYGDMQCHLDPYFEANYKGFTDVGIPIGVYYYSCANSVEIARKEALFVLDHIDDKKLLYPIYIDTENEQRQRPLTQQALTDAVKAFCDVIENSGYYVGIYASLSWFNSELFLTELKAYDKWVAQYNDKCDFTEPYGMWQYSSTGKVNGINGNVDLDHCYKDYPTIITNANLFGKQEKPAEDDFEALYKDIKEKYDSLLVEHENTLKTLEKANDKLDEIKKIVG